MATEDDMTEYTNESTPCPKCAGVVFTILSASMPTVNKCVKCSELREGEVAKRYLMPIDGCHRIAKAIKLGNEFVLCAILSEADTDSILTDRRPPLRAKPKKRKQI